MNRVWDYISFGVWFFGLGYIVMWLLDSRYFLLLPPVMHGLGTASALFVPVHALARTLSRRRAAAVATKPVSPRVPHAVLRPPWQKRVRPSRPVKPRDHFGLRGIPD